MELLNFGGVTGYALPPTIAFHEHVGPAILTTGILARQRTLLGREAIHNSPKGVSP